MGFDDATFFAIFYQIQIWRKGMDGDFKLQFIYMSINLS